MQKKTLAALLAALALAGTLSSCGRRNSASGGESSGGLGSDIGDVGSDIGDMGSDLVSDIGDAGSDIGSGLGDVGSDLGDMGSDLVSDIGDGLSDLGDGVSSLVSEIGEGVSDLTDGKDLTRSSQPAGALEDQPALETAAPVGDFSSLDGKKQGWGQGVQVDDQNRPLSPLTFQEKYGKYDAYFIGENEKVLYLTFDEGYENGYTPKILDTLKQKGVKAVFFVTLDYVKSQPELIQRMIDEGHMVGNHSDKHPCFPEVDAQRREQEIRNVDQYMADNFGYTSMNLFRPPAGEFSEQVLAQMQAMGYKTVFWSYAYKDWDPDHQMGAAKALEKVTGALHNGAIYLLHAVSKDNADILGDFIDTAQKQGYEFKLFS